MFKLFWKQKSEQETPELINEESTVVPVEDSKKISREKIIADVMEKTG